MPSARSPTGARRGEGRRALTYPRSIGRSCRALPAQRDPNWVFPVGVHARLAACASGCPEAAALLVMARQSGRCAALDSRRVKDRVEGTAAVAPLRPSPALMTTSQIRSMLPFCWRAGVLGDVQRIGQWLTDILPNWEERRQSRAVRALWRLGLPEPIRALLWPKAISNNHNINHGPSMCMSALTAAHVRCARTLNTAANHILISSSNQCTHPPALARLPVSDVQTCSG